MGCVSGMMIEICIPSVHLPLFSHFLSCQMRIVKGISICKNVENSNEQSEPSPPSRKKKREKRKWKERKEKRKEKKSLELGPTFKPILTKFKNALNSFTFWLKHRHKSALFLDVLNIFASFWPISRKWNSMMTAGFIKRILLRWTVKTMPDSRFKWDVRHFLV